MRLGDRRRGNPQTIVALSRLIQPWPLHHPRDWHRYHRSTRRSRISHLDGLRSRCRGHAANQIAPSHRQRCNRMPAATIVRRERQAGVDFRLAQRDRASAECLSVKLVLDQPWALGRPVILTVTSVAPDGAVSLPIPNATVAPCFNTVRDASAILSVGAAEAAAEEAVAMSYRHCARRRLPATQEPRSAPCRHPGRPNCKRSRTRDFQLGPLSHVERIEPSCGGVGNVHSEYPLPPMCLIDENDVSQRDASPLRPRLPLSE